MGLGGYLAWTAAAREIVKSGKCEKVIPCEIHSGRYAKIIESEIWKNNPYITMEQKDLQLGRAILMQLNNPEANYCKMDTHSKAYHRYDKHIIGQICEYYGIEDPELKCDLFFTDREKENVSSIVSGLQESFITIEPASKNNYTPNRIYPFEKWQLIVNELSKDFQIVQIGNPNSKVLNNVHSLIGKTTFREAALVIGRSKLFLSTEGGLSHAATTTDTPALVIITGYQHEKMVAYPQNINLNIATHGPCGLKIKCPKCREDAKNHDWREVCQIVREKVRK
jgi:hypothetical protein